MNESIYPGANRKTRYWPNGGGVLQKDITKLVLHSTETKGLPSYSNGGTAPSLTVNPWPGHQGVWQHFKSVTMSAKALRDTGGFAENRDNVAQIEIIGYSDPKQKNSGYFLPNLPADGIDYIAEVVAWFAREYGVPLVRPKLWPSYPASYGKSSARMATSAYDKFEGVLGHLHVPDSSHGDPTMDIDALLAAASAKVAPRKLGDRLLSKKTGEATGADVAELGKLLTAKGFDVGTPANVFGPMMDAAVRTVQKNAGLSVTGVVDAKTLTALTAPAPKPTPKPEVPEDTFTVAAYNAQKKQFGGGPYNKDAAVLRDKIKPSVVLGSEVDEEARNQITKYAELKVYPLGAVAVFFRADEFTWGPKLDIFSNADIQGAVATELTHVVNKKSFVGCAVHIRPNDAIRGTAAQKLKGKTNDVHRVVDFLKKYENVVVGGDWSTEHAYPILIAAGYRRVTPDKPTYKTSNLDSVWVRGDVFPVTEGYVLKTDASDHAAAVVDLSLEDTK